VSNMEGHHFTEQETEAWSRLEVNV